MRNIKYFLVLLLVSCSNIEHETVLYKSSKIEVSNKNTKTTIKEDSVGYTIDWTRFDQFGFFVEGVHDNLLYENSNTSSVSLFECFYSSKDVVAECSIAAYYPYVGNSCENGNVYANLPCNQKYPFDKNANFMIANPQGSIKYDKSIPDGISLDFHQLFGIIELKLTSSQDILTNDLVKSIAFINNDDDAIVSGDFRFDPFDGQISFTGANIHNFVMSTVSEDIRINKNTVLTTYLFVNPSVVYNYSIKLATETQTYCFSHSSDDAPLNIVAGEVLSLPVIDVSSVKPSGVQRRKKVVCWGDSYSCNFTPTITYTTYLQDLLGPDWIVYCGAIPGQQPLDIAPEQGGTQIYINVTSENGITIPGDTKEYTVPLCIPVDEYLHEGDIPLWRSWSASTPLLNPCTINGVQFNITKNTIKRLTPGEPLTLNKGKTNVLTWAQVNLSDADFSVMYIGANGGYGSSNDNLARIQEMMVKYIDQHTGKDSYLVLGFHERFSQSYVDLMKSYFGDDHFMSLILAVTQDEKWKQLLYQTHVVKTPSGPFPQADIERVKSGYWPLSFYKGSNDGHPSPYGANAMAILVYERMKELGYVDN